MDVQNEYLSNLVPVLYMLKVVAVFPFQFTKSSSLSSANAFKILSVIPIATFFLLSYYNIRFLIHYTKRALTNFQVNKIVWNITPASLRIFMIIATLISWNKRKCLLQYIANWEKFQQNFVTLTGSRFNIPRKTLLYRSVGIFLLNGIVCLILWKVLPWSSGIQLFSFFWAVSISNLLLLYFYINYTISKLITKKVLSEMKKCIRKVDSQKFKNLTSLWLELCDLIQQFNECHSNLFFSHLVVCTANSVVSLYVIMLQFEAKFSTTIPTGFLPLALLALFYIYIYCEVAYSLEEKISVKPLATFLSMNFMTMDSKILNDLWIFLNMNDTKTQKIILCGLVQLDRSFIFKIVIPCFNFVIILRQFDNSIR